MAGTTFQREFGGLSPSNVRPISVTQWVSDLTGVTDQSPALLRAITAVQSSGDELYIPPGASIRSDNILDLTSAAPLYIGGGGRILLPPPDLSLEGIRYAPPPSTKTAISKHVVTQYNSAGPYVSRLTVADVSAFARGGVCFFQSEEATSFDAAVKYGELLPVLAVDSVNKYLYMMGMIAHPYSPTKLVVSAASGSFTVGETITGGTSGATAVVEQFSTTTALYVSGVTGTFTVAETVTGGTSAKTATVTSSTALLPYVRRLAEYDCRVQVAFSEQVDPFTIAGGEPTATSRAAIVIEGTIQSKLDIRLRDLVGYGVRPVSCWQPEVNLITRRQRDRDAFNPCQLLGYGITATCATRGGRFKVIATDVRHGFTTNMYVRGGYDLWSYGTQRDNWVTGTVHGATAAAFDCHAGAFDTVYEDCVAVGSYQDLESPAGTNFGLQDRGCNTVVRNMKITGAGMNGISIGGQTTDYLKANRLVVDGLVHQGVDDGTHRCNAFGYLAAVSNTFEQHCIFKNCTWESVEFSEQGSPGPTFFFDNCDFRYGQQRRWSPTSVVFYRNCRTRAGSSPQAEAWNFKSASVLTVDGYTGELGTHAQSALFRTFGSSGNVTLKYRNVVDLPGTNVLCALDGVTTVTLTPIKELPIATATWDPANTASGAIASTTLTVTSLAVGTPLFATFSNAMAAGTFMKAVVTATGTITVTYYNFSGGAIDLASGTVSVYRAA